LRRVIGYSSATGHDFEVSRSSAYTEKRDNLRVGYFHRRHELFAFNHNPDGVHPAGQDWRWRKEKGDNSNGGNCFSHAAPFIPTSDVPDEGSVNASAQRNR
jgi:hypothetical protein